MAVRKEPEGTRIWIYSRRNGPSGPSNGPATEVDSRGQFTLEGMTIGDHELELNVRSRGNPNLQFPSARQSVTVVKGKETVVTLILNLGSKTNNK